MQNCPFFIILIPIDTKITFSFHHREHRGHRVLISCLYILCVLCVLCGELYYPKYNQVSAAIPVPIRLALLMLLI